MSSYLQRIPAVLRRLLFVRASLHVYGLFLIRILGTACSLLYTVLLGRTYGADGTGLFYIYRNWFNILGNQLTGNYHIYLTRKAIFFQAEGRPAASIAFVDSVAIIVACLSLALIAGSFVFPAAGWKAGLAPQSVRVLLVLAASAGALFLVVQNLSAGLRAFNNAPASLLLQFVIPPALAALAIGLSRLSSFSSVPVFPAASFTLSYFFTAIIAGFIWRRVVARVGAGASEQGAPASVQKPVLADFVNKGAMVLVVAGWISISLENLPFYFLSAVGSLKEIAYYGVADRLVSISSSVLYSLSSDYLARFSRLYAQRDLGGLRREFIKSQFYCLLFFAPFLAAFLFFPGTILGLFGAGFEAGRPYLFILLVGDVVNAATGLVGTVLFALEDEVFVLRLQVVSLLLLAASLPLAWSQLGGLGIAIVASGFLALRNIVCFLRVAYLLRRSQ